MWVRGCADKAQVSPQAPQQAGSRSSVLRLPDVQNTYITTCVAINSCLHWLDYSLYSDATVILDEQSHSGVGP
jgi:hypothetical protein